MKRSTGQRSKVGLFTVSARTRLITFRSRFRKFKEALDRSQCNDPDLEPAKRKRSGSPGTAHSSESSSTLQHTGRKRSCRTTVSLRNERKRLLYVMQQILDETIAAKNT